MFKNKIFIILLLLLLAFGALGAWYSKQKKEETTNTSGKNREEGMDFRGKQKQEIVEKSCEKQLIPFEATDKKTKGFLYIPKEGDGPFPAVVALHGGFSSTKLTETAGDNYASEFCPSGYAVFAVDYRWTPFGKDEMLDVSGAYDYLITREDIDANKIVVMGGSHGGYMATLAVTAPQYKRPFLSAINLYGFLDIAKIVSSDRQRNPQVKLTLDALGDPEENKESYEEISPAFLIENLTVPTLIIVGSEDTFRDDLLDFKETLEDKEKDVQFHEVEGAKHGFESHQEPFTTTLWNYVRDYLEKRIPE